MIIVNYIETVKSHDCWGKAEWDEYTRWAEFDSVESWLKYKQDTKYIEFIAMYTVGDKITN